MQFPKLPASQPSSTVQVAVQTAKSLTTLPTIQAPAILLPPGVKVPARTITGRIPAKVRDLARFGILVNQKIATAKRETVTKTAPVPAGPVTKRPLGGQHKTTIFDAPPSGTPAFRTRDTISGQGTGITRGMLVALDDVGDILTFEYNPEQVMVDQGSGWIIADQPGRSHPFVQFGGGGQRKISFTLRLFYSHNDVGDVLQNVNWLHSFLMGQTQNTTLGDTSVRYLRSPKSLRLKMGRLFDNVPCILLRAPATYSTLFRPNSLLPLYAEVQLEFLEIGGAGAATDFAQRRVNAASVGPNANNITKSPKR